MVRFGVEAAGRYHRTLIACLRGQGLEVVELNPGAVAEARSGQGKRRLKSDVRDLAGMVIINQAPMCDGSESARRMARHHRPG